MKKEELKTCEVVIYKGSIFLTINKALEIAEENGVNLSKVVACLTTLPTEDRTFWVKSLTKTFYNADCFKELF